MATEPKCKKLTIVLWAIIHLGISAVIIAFEFMRQDNVRDVQNDFEDICTTEPAKFPNTCSFDNDVVYYDVAWYDTPSDKYTDLSKAKEYYKELEDNCDTDCLEAGNRWSTIFVFTGTTLIFVAVVHVVLIIGIISHRSRIIGIIVSTVVSCVHLASIITTGVFRFNTMGKLSALSQMQTDPKDQNSKTYESVATLIVWLWVLQMLLCVSHCVHVGYSLKPHAG